MVRALVTETCWPTMARTAISKPSTDRGSRMPGSAATTGASAGSAASAASTAVGSASRSSSRRQRATAGARSRMSVRRSVAATYPSAGVSATWPEPCGNRKPLWYVPSRTSSTPGSARTARKSRSARACNGGRYASRSVIVPAPVASSGRPRAVRRPEGALAYTSRIVSLNCRTLPKPAANATSVIPRSVVSIRIRAVCARCARASASGPAPISARSIRCRCRSV